MYCAVKDGKAFVGNTKREVLETAIQNFYLEGLYRQLVVVVSYSDKRKYHSYKKEFADEEAINDAVSFVFNKLPDYGFILFKNDL